MDQSPSPQLKGAQPRRDIRNAALFGFGTIAVLALTVGVWSVTAPLAGAVIASGKVVVESNIRRIQHPSGGVVAQINVGNGDQVRAGDVLVRLDDTNAKASLALIEIELVRLYARQARLDAERDGLELPVLPPSLQQWPDQDSAAAAMAIETRVFAARKATADLQRSQFRERISQSHEEIQGLTSQISAREEQSRLARAELDGISALYDNKLVSLSRLTTLQREIAGLTGETGSLRADIARVKGSIVETELQILQIDEDLRREGSTELRDVEAKIADLTERRVAARDQLDRIELLAPQDGLVHELAVHTIGGVISPAEEILQIVPQADGLVIEARLDPVMVDRVHIGQEARILFPAFNAATTPELIGTLSHLSADSSTDPQSGQSFFTVRITMEKSEVAKLEGQDLLPGMPAEAYIQTGSRTALAYLIKPISDQLERSFRYD